MIDREPSITRLVDRLESEGLLERLSSTEDRRRIDCRISKTGPVLLEELDGSVDDADRWLMRGFNRKELVTLTELLDRVAVEG